MQVPTCTPPTLFEENFILGTPYSLLMFSLMDIGNDVCIFIRKLCMHFHTNFQQFFIKNRGCQFIFPNGGDEHVIRDKFKIRYK